jgi:predicted ABC-type ATPase
VTATPPSPDPVLHVLAGPNGAGKSTFATRILVPATGLPFVNADVIAAELWPDPGEAESHAYEAARLAADERARLMGERTSFITETVFSHPSKVDLLTTATAAGYHVYLHVILLPEDATVHRVAHRVHQGGHSVPEEKVRERYQRLWPLVAQARDVADRSRFYDNSLAKTPFRTVATYEHGRLVGDADWPPWTPDALCPVRTTTGPGFTALDRR